MKGEIPCFLTDNWRGLTCEYDWYLSLQTRAWNNRRKTWPLKSQRKEMYRRDDKGVSYWHTPLSCFVDHVCTVEQNPHELNDLGLRIGQECVGEAQPHGCVLRQPNPPDRNALCILLTGFPGILRLVCRDLLQDM